MGYSPNLALNAVNANVNGPVTTLGGIRSKLALQVVVIGSVSGGTVALQGSLDGVTFDTTSPLASWTAGTDQSGAIKVAIDKPTYAYRCVLNNYGGTGLITATVAVDARG